MTHLRNARIWIYLVIILMVVVFCKMAYALPVFPGAKGFGTDTRAAYGAANDPVICIVTDLTIDNAGVANSRRNGVSVKTGSLLECVNYTPPANTGKIILFEVSGYIGSNIARTTYRVDDQYVIIMGQTAPSPGVTVKNCNFDITNSDILLQHLRFRHPYDMDSGGQVIRVGTSQHGRGYYNVQNVVVDHVSVSWGAEANLLVCNYYHSSGGVTKNVTVSNCISGEGLKYGSTNYGKGSQASQQTENVAYIKNLFIHNWKRNPYTRSKAVVVVNDFVYNHGNEDPHLINADQHTAKLSYVGNMIKQGPWRNSTGNYIASLKNIENKGRGSELYTYDNRLDRINDSEDYHQTDASDWSHVRQYEGVDYESNMKVTSSPPIWPTGLVAMPSNEVEESVLANAGARPADRDPVDKRLINDVVNGTGNRDYITNPGWPTLAKNYRQLTIPSNPHGDDDVDGYTNLEEWLHQSAAQVEGSSYIGAPRSPTGLRTE